MANNVKLLDKFFEAENKRDWRSFEGYLHPDVMWFMHTEENHMPIAGRQEYMDRVETAYQSTTATYECQGIDVSESGNRIVANLLHSDGSRSVCIFDFEDSLIKWKHEFVVK